MTARRGDVRSLLDLRAATEGALDRLAAMEVAYYLRGGGSASPPALHEVCPELTTPTAVEIACSELGPPGSEALCELVVGAATAARAEPLRHRAAARVHKLGQDSAGEGDTSRAAARWEVVYDNEVAPLRLRALGAMNELLHEAGFAGRAWYATRVLQHDLTALCAGAQRFLDVTAGLYWSSFGEEVRRGNLVSMVGACAPASLQAVSVHDGIAAAQALVRGLDLRLSSHIRLDVDARSGKVPGAYSIPVRVPGEIVVAVTPRVGWADFRGLIHEWGHVMQLSSVSAELPVELRRLGDSGLVEGWGALTELLMLNARWLQVTLDVAVSGDLCGHSALKMLALGRLKALQLLFATSVEGVEEPGELRERYAAMLQMHAGLPPGRSEYLDVLANNYDAATRLRSWVFALAVQDLLRDQYGPAWPSSPAAGAWLSEVWSEGSVTGAEEAVVGWGGRRPDLSRLAAELHALLQPGDHPLES